MIPETKTQHGEFQIEAIEPWYVKDFWPQILPGLWEAARNSHGTEGTIERTKRNLETGAWVMWIGVRDGVLEGFAILENVFDDDGLWLNVPFAWSRGKMDTITPFFEEAGRMAESMEARGVKFISAVEGFEAMAKRRGWKIRYKEYIVKDFAGEK
jgi:hypothetical protein